MFSRAALLVLISALAAHAATAQVESAKLTASIPDDDDRLGWSVTLSGDVAVAGAFKRDDQGLNSGAAFVFRNTAGSWLEEATLLAADGQSSDRFGWSVSLDGDVLVVGAREDDDKGANSGSAYVFRWTGAAWVQEQKLLAADGAGGDTFGTSVSIDGVQLVVGAPGDDHAGGANAGSGYVFRNISGTWMQVAKLTALDAQADDGFGISVAISGGTALVGADQEDAGGSLAGAAYAFASSGGSWSQQQKLTALDSSPNDHFGYSVALDADLALVGAFSDNAVVSASGSAYFFRRAGTTWSQEQKVVASDAGIADLFGWAVAVEGDTALISSRLDDDGAADAGAFYVFGRDGASWTERSKSSASDAGAGDEFGYSIALDGARAVAGAWGDDDVEDESGSAYVFDSISGPQNYCTAGTSANGCQALLSATGQASATAATGFDLIASAVAGSKDGLFFFASNGRQANTWGNGTSLQCVQPPVLRAGLLIGVGTTGLCDGAFTQDLNARWTAKPSQNPGAGAVVQAQLWYRDPASTSNQTTSLSDALEFCVAP